MCSWLMREMVAAWVALTLSASISSWGSASARALGERRRTRSVRRSSEPWAPLAILIMPLRTALDSFDRAPLTKVFP